MTEVIVKIPAQGNDPPMFGNLHAPESRQQLARRPRLPTKEDSVGHASATVAYRDASKRVLDLILGVLLAIALAPVVAAVAFVIVMTSSGPAFYTQVRLGRFRKPFVIWKLRTMEHNCEASGGAKWSTPGDRRVTAIGRVLRRLHIDEFPQLINVLRGEMSMVGPRPERPEFFPVLSAEVTDYSRRLQVRPGVTGLAQVYLPPDKDISDVRRKQLYDLYYVSAGGFWLDARILVATALQAMGTPHFLVRPVLFLPKQELIEASGVPKPDLDAKSTVVVHAQSPEPAAQTAS